MGDANARCKGALMVMLSHEAVSLERLIRIYTQ